MGSEVTSTAPAIRAVLWDLGGVLYDVCVDRSRQEWARITGLDPEAFDRAFFESGIWLKLELGKMTAAQAVPAVNAVYGTSLAPAQLFAVWNATIAPCPERIALLTRLPRWATSGAISNTDPIHAGHAQQHPVLKRVIRTWTFSFEVGVEKPDPAIYRTALEKMDAPPERTLLVDDRHENVQAALDLGMDAVVYRGHDALVDALKVRDLLTSPP